MKISKKIFALGLVGLLSLGTFTSILANETTTSSILNEYTFEELSEITGIKVEELEDLSTLDIFDTMMYDHIEMSGINNPAPQANLSGFNIEEVRSILRPGDIHITTVNSALTVNHGHAALAYDRNYNIEALGYDKVSGKYTNKNWGNYTIYRLYRTKASDGMAEYAADYAYDNLRNWDYVALPSITDPKMLNCATLVWRAYKESYVSTMDKYLGYTVLPKTLADDSYTSYRYSHNWSDSASWPTP